MNRLQCRLHCYHAACYAYVVLCKVIPPGHEHAVQVRVGLTLLGGPDVVVEFVGHGKHVFEIDFLQAYWTICSGVKGSEGNGTLEGVANLPAVPDWPVLWVSLETEDLLCVAHELAIV